MGTAMTSGRKADIHYLIQVAPFAHLIGCMSWCRVIRQNTRLPVWGAAGDVL